jgi:hypothetical protein
MAIITPDNPEFRKVLKEVSSETADKNFKQLEQANETLKKILESLGSKKGIGKSQRGDVGGSSKEDEPEPTLKDELQFLLGKTKTFGAKIGSGIKESVKGAYFTKGSTTAPTSSSAEALEAQDALNQPKQVEIDQLKIAEEGNDTQKEILKELKKLNETTEESAQAGGGGGGLDVNLGGDADGKGKGKGKGKLGKAFSALGKVARFAGPVAAVAGAAYGAYEGAGRAGEVFGVDQDKATLGQKAAAGLGGIIDPFGLGYGDKAAKGVYGAFGGGSEKTTAPVSAPAAAPTSAPASTPASKTGGAIAATAAAPASKTGGAIAATAAAPATKKSGGVSADEGDANLQELQMAQGGLQELYREMKDEKAKVTEALLRDKKRFPDGIVDDPSDPEYPKELKAIDDKYKKLIDNQKKEVDKLSKAPGIKQAKAREKAEDDRFFGDEKEMAPAKTKSKVTGEKTKTTTETTVTGGGSETTKMVLSEDAKKAEAEGPAMSKRHQAEYSELRGKLEAEGKLEGKSRREIMNMPEIKELRARQDAEQEARGRRVTDGMTYEVSKTSGENTAMRDEITTSRGTTTPIVSNNSTSTSTNNYVPIKADPRPNNRGSALDNYVGRVSTY